MGERDRRGRRLRAHPRGQKEDECGFFRTGVRPSSAILAPLSLSLHLSILRSLLRANQKMQGQSSDGSQEFRNALRFCLPLLLYTSPFFFFFLSFFSHAFFLMRSRSEGNRISFRKIFCGSLRQLSNVLNIFCVTTLACDILLSVADDCFESLVYLQS